MSRSENSDAATNGEARSRQLTTLPAQATQRRLATATDLGFSATSLLDNNGISAKRCFQHLLFGLDVDDKVKKSGQLTAILPRLQRLNNSAAFWKKVGGPIPPWSSDVTPESGSTVGDPKLSSTRMFRSHDGTLRLFEWHAKFGRMRIHLFFDADSRTIEIGYIGPHLPLD